MIRRPPRSTLSSSSAASDVYRRLGEHRDRDGADDRAAGAGDPARLGGTRTPGPGSGGPDGARPGAIAAHRRPAIRQAAWHWYCAAVLAARRQPATLGGTRRLGHHNCRRRLRALGHRGGVVADRHRDLADRSATAALPRTVGRPAAVRPPPRRLEREPPPGRTGGGADASPAAAGPP